MRIIPDLKRAWLPLYASLLLSGCFPPPMTSRDVDISAAERSIDPALAGSYWFPQEGSSTGDFDVITISADPEKLYRVTSRNMTGEVNDYDESSKGVLIATTDPLVSLLLYRENASAWYTLLLHSRAGSIAFFGFLGDMETRLGKGREAVLAEVASRHGIGLRWDKAADETRLDGKLDRAHLAALFSDPEFLGALHLDPDQGFRLFPADKPLPSATNRAAWWPSSSGWAITSPRFAVERTQLARPARLLGEFTDSGSAVSVSEQPDGSLLLAYAGRPGDTPRDPRRLRLLEIGEKIRFLGLLEDVQSPRGTPGPPQQVFEYVTVTISENGVAAIEPLQLAANDFSYSLNQINRGLRSKIAKRYGLDIVQDSLGGELSAASVGALFRDRQFQAGLDCDHVYTSFALEPRRAEGGPIRAPIR